MSDRKSYRGNNRSTDDEKTESWIPREHSFNSNTPDKDDVIGSDRWNPTPAVFAGFLVRDMELATSNLRIAMQTYSGPVTVREIKEALTHSIDTIEKLLATQVKAGVVKVDGGFRYSLVA
jgi:predicted HTH transcriptional regulator